MTEEKSSELNIYDAPSALTVFALCLFPPLGLAIIRFGYKEWHKASWVRAIAATWVVLLGFAIAGGRFSIEQIRALESRKVSSANTSSLEFTQRDDGAGDYQSSASMGEAEGEDNTSGDDDMDAGSAAESGSGNASSTSLRSQRSSGSTPSLTYTPAPSGEQNQPSSNKNPSSPQSPKDPFWQDEPNKTDPAPRPEKPGGNEPDGENPDPDPENPGGGDDGSGGGDKDPDPEPNPDTPDAENA